ncbi:MAG: MurT ligase domain-containing protein [Massiliimalia sp.]
MIRTTFVIMVSKLVRFLGKKIGRGSSLPGMVALYLDRNILKKIKMPPYVIAVTGSNGKTSTVEMISYILQQNGKTVAYNREGSNQIEGVTTFLIDNCDLKGRIKTDVVLIESDERYARYTFQKFHPTHYIITNLYRDQLTRNGHPEWIYNLLQQSIHEDTTLLLNADDPLVSCFGLNHPKTVWFGVDRFSESTDQCTSVYNDGAFCPNCKHPMEYRYHHYNHIGDYHCPHCGLEKHKTDYTVTSVDLDAGNFVINGKDSISMRLKSIYNVYNILAAYSVCCMTGIDGDKIAQSIDNYTLKNGRVTTFQNGALSGVLLSSKHENSISYDQSMRVALHHKGDCTVTIIVDAISRKYFTSDTSWLWDVDFEMLSAPHIKKIVLVGNYCHDLATRFEYTGIDPQKITMIQDIQQAVDYQKEHGIGYQYVITCFSDKDKFLTKVQQTKLEDAEAI